MANRIPAESIEELIECLENGEEILDEEYSNLVFEDAYVAREVDTFAHHNIDDRCVISTYSSTVYECKKDGVTRYIQVDCEDRGDGIEWDSMKLVKPIIVEKTEWVDETA